MFKRTKETRRERPKSEFDSKVLEMARVARMTSGGRRMRFRAVVIVGNRKGKVGIGIAKGADVAQAVDKATRLGQKELIDVLIVDETIPHQTEAKFGSSQILLKPQKKGRGLIAGGVVRVICSLAGIKNISSKVIGRTGNKLNNAKATIEALKKLRARVKKQEEGSNQNL
jgi:small subunit ribosomal protein S5